MKLLLIVLALFVTVPAVAQSTVTTCNAYRTNAEDSFLAQVKPHVTADVYTAIAAEVRQPYGGYGGFEKGVYVRVSFNVLIAHIKTSNRVYKFMQGRSCPQ